ncbi:MAG: alpha/beta hydrolase fold domain-containing protein [Actinomycetota bacterium]
MLRTVSGPLSDGPAAFPAPSPRRGQADELVWEGLCFAAPAGHRPLYLDLHVPRTVSPAQDPPVIVWVHGGGWEAGSRRRLGWELERGWIVERMVMAGFAVAVVDYRLTGDAPFPAQVQDVTAAAAWLADHHAHLGIDTSRVALWGESAGGHLALLVGAAGLTGDATVRAVVDWYAPTDLPALFADKDLPKQEHAWLAPEASPLVAIAPTGPLVLTEHPARREVSPPHGSLGVGE